MSPSSICPAGFLDRLDTFSQIGATPDGGVDRMEATPANGAARRQLIAWLEEAGFGVRVDAIGNIFGLMQLAGQDDPWIMTGSHIDSQPMGGRLDGAYGVLASLDAAIALRERLRAAGGRARANLCLVAWTSEEGARFQPSLLGSSVYTGLLDLEAGLGLRDGDGISVAEAFAAIGVDGRDEPPPRPLAYVELHVECAPELERSGERLGIFHRWWGAHKIELRFEGATAHTGPTPMAERRDALVAAAEVITDLRAMADAADIGSLHTSVGRLEVAPNSPNVVPRFATLFCEIRSPDAEIIAAGYQRFAATACGAAARARVAQATVRDELREPGRFDAGLIAVAEQAAAQFGIAPMPLDTIAAHDAIPLARVGIPSVVLAVPSRDGLCHSPREWTDPRDLELGVAWLSAILEELVTRAR